MTDEEMESRLLRILTQKFKSIGGFYERSLGVRSWTRIISSAGCELMSSKVLKSDDNDIFVNHRALGMVRIPRDIAIKILVLGGIP